MELIENLPELFKNILGNTKIQHFEIKRLTAPGENYGSLMLKLDLTLNKKEKLYLVAKKIPIDEVSRETFKIEYTFKNEVFVYKTLIPILQDFQKENGVENVIDCFAKYYCDRFNIDGSDNIDENAVLIMENLVNAGYGNIDRTIGFNLESSKIILKDLAEFHAVPLAFKLKKPDAFVHLKKQFYDFEFPKQHLERFLGITRDIIKENQNCAKLINKINLLIEVDKPGIKEPFATLIHYDLWCNNTMQIFSGDLVLKNKFLDFQFVSYGSPATDLFFFIWTSVQLPVLQNHFDDLLIYYYNNFIKNLKQLKCDTQVFSYEDFLEEIKRVSEFEVGHALHFILFVVHGQKDLEEDIALPDIEKIKNVVSMKAKKHVWYMLEECERRGWLYKN